MCLRIYIGSDKHLPTINWNENNPQFYINPGDDNTITQVKAILGCIYVYEAGSFMGCGCGFCHDPNENDEPEDKKLRSRDIALFKEYLIRNRDSWQLKIFATWWENFPEVYPFKNIEIEKISDEFTFFEEEVVYQIL